VLLKKLRIVEISLSFFVSSSDLKILVKWYDTFWDIFSIIFMLILSLNIASRWHFWHLVHFFPLIFLKVFFGSKRSLSSFVEVIPSFFVVHSSHSASSSTASSNKGGCLFIRNIISVVSVILHFCEEQFLVDWVDTIDIAEISISFKNIVSVIIMVRKLNHVVSSNSLTKLFSNNASTDIFS